MTLVLPSGLARTSLMEVPTGTSMLEFVRFRLGGLLPWPPADAVFGHLKLDARHALGAAVRRDVVGGYEALVRAAGLEVERVELAPLVGLAAFLRVVRGVDLATGVLVGDAAISIATFRRGRLLSFRSRRRAPGDSESERLREDVVRSVVACGFTGRPRVFLAGPEADKLLCADGWFELAPFRHPLSWERPWLGGVLA